MAARYRRWPGAVRAALSAGPPRQRHPQNSAGEDTHHVGHVLDEDLAAKPDLGDHLSWHVRPQVPLLSDELLQTRVREDVFGADVHGPWGGAGAQPAALPPPSAGLVPAAAPLLTGRHPGGCPQPVSSGSEGDHQGPWLLEMAPARAAPLRPPPAAAFPSEAPPGARFPHSAVEAAPTVLGCCDRKSQ